jgi:hypothetical protein
MFLHGLLSVTFPCPGTESSGYLWCCEPIRFYAGVRRSRGASAQDFQVPPENKVAISNSAPVRLLYTYCIRVRLIFYAVFTQVFTVFSDFHCQTHGFFSVYFRFRKPAESPLFDDVRAHLRDTYALTRNVRPLDVSTT